MHHFRTCFLSRLALFLLLPVFFANATPFVVGPRYDLHDVIPSVAGKELQESETTKMYRRGPAFYKPSPLESDRSRSLMILPRRDLSQVKQILRVIWYKFAPPTPDTLPEAAPVVKAMFSRIYDLVTTPEQRQVVDHVLTFSYGAFQMTIYCANQVIPWDTIKEVVQHINEKIIGGMIGFFEANFLTVAGATIVVAYTLIIGAIFWLARIPPQDELQNAVDWMRFGG